MKKLIIGLLTSVVLFMSSTSAQNIPPASMADVDFSLVSWERGQVLVRFADQLSPTLNTAKSQTKITLVDQILADYQGVKLEQLFPVQKPIPGGEKGFTTYSGKYYEYPKLTNIYKLTIKDTTYGAVFPLITAMENLGDDYVVYAEPNYHFESDVTVPPADALYQYQYNASSMNADSAWQIMNDSSITEEDIIIAIIDTGVDTAHVDLKGKKHINIIEANGQPGVDDDGNGYIDDISGWDFVNMDNGPIDDNSHGTHCAAIAVANHDSIGIAGIAPNAKYIPMKGLESSGGSSASALAQCATYAANNGADILSMSVGGYGRSLAFENALAYSYAFSIPVGAAGNDGICIRNDGQLCPDGRPPAPMFPGAYTFVLAAQATQQNSGWNGYRAWFTNYDFDGPTFTDYPDDFNYEVYAPGLGIISAIPGNQYATWNGTSMACPAVAGAVAIHRAFRPNRTKEQVFVDFIQSWYDMSKIFDKGQGYSTGFNSIDIVKALYPEEMPILWMNQFSVVDSSQGDGDSKADAGEHLSVRVDMKNVGTESDSVYVGIRMAEFEDKTIVHFIDSTAFLGSISSYATVSNNLDLFELQIDSGVVNGRNILFNIFSWTPGGDTTSQDYMIEAQSGCEYMGIYSGTTVWTPDCGIIVTANSAFDTLIIKPGTEIQIDPGVGIGYSHILAEGKPDSMIVFTKNQNAFGTWNEIKNFGSDQAVFKYCVFEYGGRTGTIGGSDIIGPGNSTSFEDCVFRYCHAWYGIGWNILNPSDSSYVRRCNFIDNQSNLSVVNLDNPNWTGDFSNNNVSGNIYVQYYGEQPAVRFANQSIIDKITNNSFFKHGYQSYDNTRSSGYVLGVRDGNGGGHTFSTYVNNFIDSNFYGTINDQSINANIFDFEEFSSFPSVSGSEKKLIKPKAENHGHVWKILLDTAEVNIYNDPIHKVIGLGRHSVSVVFNRPMNITETPFVTYGVRFPYTQNIVSDSSWWSSDSLTWNSYFDITQLTASDGYNKFGVRNIHDNDGFEIPIEDYRFQFRVNVAGALSTGFTAVGDTSEIRLSWSAPDSIVDLIGYNILRVDTSQNNHDTNIVNNSLVLDTNYTDDNVIGGNYYLYYYAPVRSSFTESQRSIGVWATPYSSKPRVKTLKAQETSNGTIQFNAGIDANFIETEARFLYGTNPTNLNGATSWQSIGSNYYEVPFDRFISSVTAGTIYYYQAQAKNSLGLETGKVDSILTMSTPALTISGATQICSGDSISLAAQSVTPDTTMSLTWKYNGGIIGQGASLKHLPSGQGTYSIELHAEGTYTTPTVESYSVSITGVINNIAVTTTGSSQLCQGQTVNLSIPSGYSDILWNTGDTTSTISANQTGSYSATMKTSVAGCAVASASVNIVVNPLPVATVSTSSGAFDFCDGSSLTLEGPTGSSGYQWYKDGTALAGATGATLSATTSGSYAVQVISTDGCSSLSSAQSVTKNALPTATISNASALSFCDGGSVTLSAPSGMSYAWSTGATTQTVTQSSSGQLGLTITDANGCSSVASPVTVNVYSVPALTVTSASSTSICQGESVTLQAGGGFSSYAWSNGATNQNLIATTAGNYTVTGTTSDGCTATSVAQSVVVNGNPVATVTNSGSSVLCSGGSATLSAPSGMSSYLWSDGSTSQSITTSTAGNYTVTVTNAGGCSSTSTAAAITTSSITTPSISSSGSTTLCSGSNVTLSVPTGYSSYLWSNGATTSATSVSASGSYSVTLTNADGCSTTTTATAVTVNTPPTASITSTGTGAICAGSSETLSATSGMSSYQWYANGTAITGATSATYTATASGNYSVSVVDANGCSDISTNYAITNAAPPVATITNAGSSVLCSGGSATLSAPSGMSSYLWSDGSTSQSITTSTAGNYTVTVTNAGGCSSTSTATAITTISITTPNITASGSTTLCSGSNVTLSVPTGYASYLWSDGSTTNSISPTTAGSYSVTLTNADGCSTTTTATSVTVNPLPTASVSSASGSFDFCDGSSLTLEGPTGSSGYQWYKDGTALAGATGATLSATTSGSYAVQVISTDGCSSLSSAQSVTKNALPTATISNASALSFCDGGSVTLSAPSGMSYAWSTGATTQTVTQSSSGQLGLTITDANGCSSVASPVTVNVYSVPALTVTSASSTSICQGESVTLQAGGGFSSYAWSNGATNQNLIATTAGNYTVTGTTSDGCTATSVAQSVVVNGNPVATVTNSGSSVLCSGGSATLSAPSGMSSYLWSDGSTSQSITTSTAGNYTVTVTNAGGCSSTSTAAAITTSSITTPSISSSGSTTLCSGSNVTLSVPTGYSSYLWSNGATTSATSVSASGSYSVTLTNADGCSTTTTATAVTVNTPPTASITSTGTGAICAGSSETLSATSGMSSYQWYANGTAITGATSATYTATASGNYSVSVVDANGCSDISTNYAITNAAPPVATITNAGSSVLCSGGSATLSAPSGMSSYLWSDGSTSQSITTSTAGNYTVTVTNAGGCSSTSSAAAITTSSITTPSISSSGSTTLCSGSNVTLSVPTGYSSYLWSNGATTSATSVSASGSYSVTLTNADGCSTTTSATAVTVNTPPTASITSTGTGAICAGASETLSATSGMSSYQWYANGTAITGATSATYTANASGNYSVSVVDANGCSDISTNYAITNAAAPVATITNAGSSVLCSGDSTTLTAPSGMSSYLWSDGSTSQSLSVTSFGNYSVTVTNANGCSATSPTTVISASQITAPTVTSNGALEFCDGGTVSLAVPAGYSSFMWNNGSGFSQIMATTSGDYYTQVMNADGCSVYSDTVTVTVFPTPPTPSISYTANDTLMISSELTGNQWYFNGNMMPGETGQTLRPLNLGNYSVRVVDSNSCEGDMSAMQFYNSIGLEESLVDQIKLYPNPTSVAVTLELGGVNVASIRIYDARGRLLEALNQCSGNCRIELGMFEDGLYQLVILTEEGKTVTKPVVLQR